MTLSYAILYSLYNLYSELVKDQGSNYTDLFSAKFTILSMQRGRFGCYIFLFRSLTVRFILCLFRLHASLRIHGPDLGQRNTKFLPKIRRRGVQRAADVIGGSIKFYSEIPLRGTPASNYYFCYTSIKPVLFCHSKKLV